MKACARTLSLALVAACVPAAIVTTDVAAGAAAPALGNKPSYGPDISATGRYVVFASDATNLVRGDTNGKRDVFIRDLQTKTTRLVSKVKGQLGNANSYAPNVSDNGRYVSFSSDASNLVAADTNGVTDVFRADLTTGTIQRVSVTRSGAQANGKSESPRMSGNGGSIAFLSAATNLVSGDTNKAKDVFLRDLAAKSTRRISLAETGDQLRWSDEVSMSANGAVVGFRGSSGSYSAVYRWARSTGRSTVIDEDWVGSVRANNGSVSYGWEGGGMDCIDTYLEIMAKPDRLSFELYGGCGGGYFYDYDTSAWGAMAAVAQLSYSEAVEVYDASKRLARLGDAGANAVSMSSDGSRVAFASAGQIKVWTWKTGAVAIASST